MKARYDSIIAEPTGRTGAEACVVRCYRENPLRLEWAYGDSEASAFGNFQRDPHVIVLEDFDKLGGGQ